MAALVAGCDGERPLGELAAVLRLAFGVDPEEVRTLATGLADRAS